MLRSSVPNSAFRRPIHSTANENQTDSDCQSLNPSFTAKKLHGTTTTTTNVIGKGVTPMTPCLHRGLFKKAVSDHDTPTKPSHLPVKTPNILPSSSLRPVPSTNHMRVTNTLAPTPVRRLNLAPKPSNFTPYPKFAPTNNNNNIPPPKNIQPPSCTIISHHDTVSLPPDNNNTQSNLSSITKNDVTNQSGLDDALLSSHLFIPQQPSTIISPSQPLDDYINDTYPGVNRPLDNEIEYCPPSTELLDESDMNDDYLLFPMQYELAPIPTFEFIPPIPGEVSESEEDEDNNNNNKIDGSQSTIHSPLSPIKTKISILPPRGPLRAIDVVDLDYDRTASSLEESSASENDVDDILLSVRHRHRRNFLLTDETDVINMLVFKSDIDDDDDDDDDL